MNIAAALLRAPHTGIKQLKDHLSAKYLTKLRIITDHGEPISVALPYNEVLEMIDIIDELSDQQTLKIVQEGRAAIKAGAKGIPVSQLFDKI